ncbi:MAG: WecB/TagA/CpsF family glycosyltransferase [Treponema sp.]|nr:WecB/TagA/CpsF family glycosyltransferase [Treponema sp.]
MAMQRREILGVPVDVCKPEELETDLLDILLRPGTKQILFLSVWDLIRARKSGSDLNQCLKSADMIIPVSKSIIKAARKLKLPVPVRYNPFHAVINILEILEQHYKSLFILGERQKTLNQAERNLHDTFPNLQIVGRYTGYYPKHMEANVVQAIYKCSPSLVLLSDGIKEKNLWAYNRRNSFNSSIFLYYKDCLGIFAERRKRVSDKTFDRGHEMYLEVIKHPIKIFLIFPYLGFKIRVFWNRIFGKKNRQS